MMDRQARNELATALGRLAAGELTNDEFDDVYFGKWNQSSDAAVAEIAGFGWTLYDDTRRKPYRLQGPDAVPEKVQPFVERALRFLQSDREYEWPKDVFGIRPATGAALIRGRIWVVSYVLLWLAVVLLLVFERSRATLFIDLVSLAVLTAIVHLMVLYGRGRERRKRFLAAGDFDSAWPFRTSAEVESASGAKLPARRIPAG
jgi:hypothetical protein